MDRNIWSEKSENVAQQCSTSIMHHIAASWEYINDVVPAAQDSK